MSGPTPLSADLPLRYGVPIGQTIDFSDARVKIIGAYQGQVRCHFEELDPKTHEPTGRKRTKTVPRAEYDKWVEDARPGSMPKPGSPASAAEGRRVKIMRVSPSGQPAVVFEDASFESLAAGDVFVVVEPDGTDVPGGPWMARGAAYRGEDGWAVDCDAIKLEDVEPSAADGSDLGDPNLVVG